MQEEVTTNMQKLVFHLMEQGLNNEEVARALAQVTDVAFEEFSTEAMSFLTPEEVTAIESAETEGSSDEEIKRLFTLHTGKDAKEYLSEILQEQAATYMQNCSQSSAISQ